MSTQSTSSRGASDEDKLAVLQNVPPQRLPDVRGLAKCDVNVNAFNLQFTTYWRNRDALSLRAFPVSGLSTPDRLVSVLFLWLLLGSFI